jgi:hypothetical protein
MRIRIQQLKLMRIHADPDTDPDPKPWNLLDAFTPYMVAKGTELVSVDGFHIRNIFVSSGCICVVYKTD